MPRDRLVTEAGVEDLPDEVEAAPVVRGIDVGERVVRRLDAAEVPLEDGAPSARVLSRSSRAGRYLEERGRVVGRHDSNLRVGKPLARHEEQVLSKALDRRWEEEDAAV